MNIEDLHIGIIGATGVVGQQVMEIMESRGLLPKQLHLAASKHSAGETRTYMGKDIEVEELTKDFFGQVDIAIASAGSKVSEKFLTPELIHHTVIIDNCSFYRMDKDVPLVIPEVNGFELDRAPAKSIIANPNCTTIGMLMALGPIHQQLIVQQVVCSSYQSVSGAGQKGIEELSSQVQSMFQTGDYRHHVFDHRIAFNCLPVIGALDEDGFSDEERKMDRETKKILDDSIAVTSTCVRVPTFIGHGMSLHVKCEEEVDINEVREILSNAPGVKLIDAPEQNVYPILTDCQGQDDVYVGRVRPGLDAHSFHLWVVSDNVRKGAALNAVQILEHVITQPWFGPMVS
ncbi:MAG: aspartate-semialdehyde dehydrogenase [Deltaproteobacteria bacterium]|nr:aspartate-semialdehyde dehydrogenase [Deltaproteobacteria bacterium]